MTAKLTTADDQILARLEEPSSIDEGIVSRSACDKLRFGAMQFDCGYLSPYFITDPERMEVTFENVRKDLLPLLGQITDSGKPLLIIAEDVAGEALAALVVNKLRGPLQVAAVRAPTCGDQRRGMLDEMALLTGGKAITGDFPLRNVQISDLGQAKKIVIDRHHTVVESGVSAAVNNQPTVSGHR